MFTLQWINVLFLNTFLSKITLVPDIDLSAWKYQLIGGFSLIYFYCKRKKESKKESKKERKKERKKETLRKPSIVKVVNKWHAHNIKCIALIQYRNIYYINKSHNKQ